MTDDTLFRAISGLATEAEHEAVHVWRELSGENERRYQALRRLLELSSEADRMRTPGPPPSAAQILARSQERPTDLVARRTASRRLQVGRPGRAWVAPLLAAAAGILLTLGLSQFWADSPTGESFGAKEFVTGVSEMATVVFVDGTVVRLAGDSRMRVPEGTRGREVSLTGRAFFAVAPDEKKPFIVKTGRGDLRVLGTRFALDVSDEDLRLVVVEGHVTLAGSGEQEDLDVGASQMARVVNGTSLPVVDVAGPGALPEWVGNFLAFQATPVAVALEEIEREYGIEIRVSGSGLTDRTITAWFEGTPLEEVIDVVCIVVNAHCVIEESVVTITPWVTGRT